MALALGLAGCARLVGIRDLEGADASIDAPWTANETSSDGTKDVIDSARVADPDATWDARPDASGAAACASLVWQEAAANLYTPKAVAACNYALETLPALVAGIDDEGFARAQGCGTCLRVVAGDPATATKSVDVLVVERVGAVIGQGRQISLSRAAMDAVASPETSLTVLSFAVVPCAPPLIHDTIHIAQKQGSGPQHLEIMIRDSRVPVTMVELKHAGAWKPLTLMPYDYWRIEQPNEDRVYDLQLTAGDEKLHANRLTLTSTATQDGPLVDTGLQFSLCSGL